MVFPEFLCVDEVLRLFRELLLDILGIEDIFKIKEVPLKCKPLIDDIRNHKQFLLPFLNNIFDLVYETSTHHG
jgi:hypothetical protein